MVVVKVGNCGRAVLRNWRWRAQRADLMRLLNTCTRLIDVPAGHPDPDAFILAELVTFLPLQALLETVPRVPQEADDDELIIY